MTELTIRPLTANFQQGVSKPQQNAGGTVFDDMLEMVNPLHHLPVVSHLYRAESGNDIPAIAKMVGAGLFGGVIGAVGSAAVSLIEAVSGEPILQMAKGIAEGETPHQPFAATEQQAFALAPDNGAASFELAANPQIVAQALANNAPALAVENAPITRLRDIRQSEIGLPESSIEAQIRASQIKLLQG